MKIKKLGFLLWLTVLIGILVFSLGAFAEYQGSKWKPAPEDLWKWQQFKGETIYVNGNDILAFQQTSTGISSFIIVLKF